MSSGMYIIHHGVYSLNCAVYCLSCAVYLSFMRMVFCFSFLCLLFVEHCLVVVMIHYQAYHTCCFVMKSNTSAAPTQILNVFFFSISPNFIRQTKLVFPSYCQNVSLCRNATMQQTQQESSANQEFILLMFESPSSLIPHRVGSTRVMTRRCPPPVVHQLVETSSETRNSSVFVRYTTWETCLTAILPSGKVDTMHLVHHGIITSHGTLTWSGGQFPFLAKCLLLPLSPSWFAKLY